MMFSHCLGKKDLKVLRSTTFVSAAKKKEFIETLENQSTLTVGSTVLWKTKMMFALIVGMRVI